MSSWAGRPRRSAATPPVPSRWSSQGRSARSGRRAWWGKSSKPPHPDDQPNGVRCSRLLMRDGKDVLEHGPFLGRDHPSPCLEWGGVHLDVEELQRWWLYITKTTR